MKIIDLLNKIANGEEVPRKVKYKTYYWEYKQESKDYKDNEDDWVFRCSNYDIPEMLNNEIEIIEEEKRIPEKIDIHEDEEGHYFIDKHCKKIYITCDEINFMVEEFNQLIDYLKSKGAK